MVDDAATDGTPAFTKHYARLDHRIRALRPRNGGTAQARNAALEYARAPFVAIRDDDDRQVPQRWRPGWRIRRRIRGTKW